MSDAPIALTTKDFATGYLGDSNSKDYFTLAVTAGQTYSIAVIGIGQDPLTEVTVSAVDELGAPVTLDDRGAVPDWFDKKFTAITSGNITFELAPTDSDFSGQYGLKVTEGLQNDFSTLMGAGALYMPGAWGQGAGEGTTVTYGFRASPPTYVGELGVDLTTFSVLTPTQMASFNDALALWSEISNIKFQAINPGGYTDDATILVGNYFKINSSEGAYAYYPQNQGNRSGESKEGDVWLNLNAVNKDVAAVPGTYSYFVVMHELGHALGLPHPGPYDADGSVITYANSAKFIQDSGQYTIMTYFDGFNTGQTPGNWIGSSNPQLFDILAMQNKYGPNMQTRAGDTVYGFGSNAGPIYDFALNSAPQFSIWDGGGIDTLDVSGFNQQQIINLNPGTFSNISGQIYNISIALNVSIENAVGGSGDDYIYGNAVGNRIHAGAGHDSIKGGYANDHIDGGEGIDTAIYTGASYQYGGSKSSGTVIDSVDSRDGLDILVNVERLAFTDTMVALDTAFNENAGNTYLLYQAAFDRAPDVEGLGYWIGEVDNGANIVSDVALNFILSEEFISLYGASIEVPEFITLLYQNVLDRTPDAPGYIYWLNEFAEAGDSLAYRAGLLNNFAISAENIGNVADQIVNGIQYQAFVV
jgi:serralysin